MHCAKCIVRSDLWDANSLPDPRSVPSLSNAIIEQKGYAITPEQLQQSLRKDIEERLY
jgi:hypothetical protein